MALLNACFLTCGESMSGQKQHTLEESPPGIRQSVEEIAEFAGYAFAWEGGNGFRMRATRVRVRVRIPRGPEQLCFLPAQSS